MGVASEGQGDTGRYVRENIGLVRKKERGQIVIEVAQCAIEIVGALASKGELISEPRDPKAVLPPSYPDRGILQKVNVSLLEAPADKGGLPAPPIVITQNRKDAKRCVKLPERSHPFADRNERSMKAAPQRVYVIAQKHDKVRRAAVEPLCNRTDTPRGHPWLHGVKVGHDSDAEGRGATRPGAMPDRPFLHNEAKAGLDRKGIEGA
jgi:hypothetical protein